RERPSPPRVLRQRLARRARELDGGASRQGAERVDPARLDDERLRERLAGLVAQNPLVEPHRARQPPRRAHGDVAERPRGEPEVDGERRPEAHRPRGRRRLHAERRHLHDPGPRAWARHHGPAPPTTTTYATNASPTVASEGNTGARARRRPTQVASERSYGHDAQRASPCPVTMRAAKSPSSAALPRLGTRATRPWPIGCGRPGSPPR